MSNIFIFRRAEIAIELFMLNMLNTGYPLIQIVGKYILILTTDFGTNVTKQKEKTMNQDCFAFFENEKTGFYLSIHFTEECNKVIRK